MRCGAGRQWTKSKAGGAARKLGGNSEREGATRRTELANLQTKHVPVLAADQEKAAAGNCKIEKRSAALHARNIGD